MKSTPKKNKLRSFGKRKAKEKSFPIVAIGASAGGLEAVTQLLENLAPNTGMTFIYVQHLSPNHRSILTALLSKLTSMKVQEVKNKMLMEPNNLYIIPPDKEMMVMDGHIKLTPRPKGHIVSLPIDTFFCSLAEKHRDESIGIILSGSANDGTRGLKAIKGAGGLTFAQDSTAKFGSMPKSAIAAGAVDYVLSPKEIGRELTRLSKLNYLKDRGTAKNKDIENDNPDLNLIMGQLYKQTSVDFSLYKIATIKRRILRRMLLNKIKTLHEYAKLISEKSDEVTILYQDLLINVTTFFRDTDAYEYLKSTIFPRILKSKTANETLRIWIPACSTGEEVYSIAMMLLEIQGGKSTNIPIQIFATDLSEQAIAKARIGEYSKQEIKTVSPKRLHRFYAKSGVNYRIAKVVRDMCVFAPHNILSDPPFSHVDFISCCNLLIYLDVRAQKKVISTFHYALKKGGYLMLGKSETIGASTSLFARVNNKFKVYSRKEKSGKRTLPDLSGRLLSTRITNKEIFTKTAKNKTRPNAGFNETIDAILLSRYVPASVVINYSMEILQFRGPTDLYLKHSSGKASLNILKMIPPEIAFQLRHSISSAIKTARAIRKDGIEMKSDIALRIISIEVIPVTLEWDEPVLLILFTEPEQVEAFLQEEKDDKNNGPAKNRMIIKLKRELSTVRADIQSFVKEQEVFNEEMQHVNEEAVSSNEELQSVNEELETSKEEIESTNEELITTNQELETRNELLNESYGYSEAIINTIHEPMVILDKDLRVKSANESFYRNFKVSKEDTERSLLYDLGNKQWNIPGLRRLLEDIIPRNSHFHNFEVTHTFEGIGKKIMLLNASRIVQKTHGDQLILLAINDITDHALLLLKEKELLKKDVEETKSYALRLEQAVEERTKAQDQSNRILAEKNIELEKMNHELEAFTYVSSHDLQEPLRKIQTFATRILETENKGLSEKGVDYFNSMRGEADRMQKLIEDLLAFSRLNVAEREFETVDLTIIVKEVISDLKEVINEKRATIDAKNLCEARIIPFQFTQLLHNLINNALKYSSPKRKPRILIKSKIQTGRKLKNEKLVQDKSYCHISITDNGIGFNQKYKHRIFEVFQRLHGKHEYSGTGIGLAIVKKVVENHNGAITVTSKLNKGATFNIYLPVL